jgi:RimJ/RimL family protein N-acetyltransferase
VSQEIEIKQIDNHNLLGQYLPSFLAFFKTINLETFPEEKPWSDSQIIEITKQNADQSLCICAFDNEQMVGYSRLGWSLCKPGYGRMFLNILPDYRRQGLGSSIFKQILDHARSIGLSKLICQTHHRSGEEFIANRGGKLVAKESTRTLIMSNVDWEMIDDWIATGKTRNPSLGLVFSKHVEDSMIPGLAMVSLEIDSDLANLNGNQLEISYEFEVEEWKRRQTAATSPNQSRIFLFVHDGCGEVVGYSNISIQNSDPTFARQGMTAVKKDCRGAGIGKLIKASMLRFIRNNHPEITKVSTGNNDLNAPIVAINEKLGFTKGVCWTNFEIDLSQK